MRRTFLTFSFLIFLVACDGGGSSGLQPYPEDSSESMSSAVESSAESSSEMLSSVGESSSSDESSSSETLSNSSSSVASSSVSLSSSSSSLPKSSSSIFVPPCKTETEDNCEYGSLIDERDGQVYKTVKIGEQWWMAENLNYAYLQPTAELDSSSWCYNDSAEYCEKFGRLYLWSAAMDSVVENTGKCGFHGICDYETKTCTVECNRDGTRGVCPEGWHLPTRWEFETLSQAVSGSSRALKSRDGWQSNNGVDSYGFDVKPTGFYVSYFYIEEIGFHSLLEDATFWASTDNRDFAYAIVLNNSGEEIYVDGLFKHYAFSVRCIKD